MVSKTFEASQTFWEEEMAGKILNFLREEIYLELPFLGIALSVLKPKADTRLQTLATDGETLFFSPAQLLRVFPENSSIWTDCISTQCCTVYFPIFGLGDSGRENCGDSPVMLQWSTPSTGWTNPVPDGY